jgi:formamidopyrimidine-DNA glycosylase
MPELPDVEIFRRLAEKTCLGRVVAEVPVIDPGMVQGISPASLRQRITGKRVGACRRHGKVLFIEMAADGTLAMHFGMNGSLRHLARDEKVPAHTHFSLGFAEGDQLAYLNPRRIGGVHFAGSMERFISDTKLGPDALAPAFDLAAFEEALGNGRQAIKSVLMEQSRLAGIGNIYADEILFQARLHPGLATRALDKAARSRLYEAMRHVFATAVAVGAGAEKFTETLPKHFLIPHRQAGGRCPRCGTALRVFKLGGRTGYSCPQCQPAG